MTDRAPDPAAWLSLWRERLQGDARLPEDEARAVIAAVADDLRAGAPEALDRAGKAWARAHRSISAMVGRLSSLREALAAGEVADDSLRMHKAIDRITAAATEEALNRLEQASRTDALTGVGNRRAFDETLSATLSAATRQGHEVTVVAVDLDGLKRINDTEGHAAGDAALMALVRAFYTQLRDEDRVFRVGGDEFVILLPFTSVDAAELLMERIHRGGAPAFTWGAAGYSTAGGDARRLVEAADLDLYRRRQDRRAVSAPVRGLSALQARQGLRRVGSWAWVPAAAVVVASLIATLVTSNASSPLRVAKGPTSHPVTKPAGGGPPVLPQTGTGSGNAANGTPGAPAVTVGYATPLGPAIGAPGGPGTPGSPSSPGSPGGPGTSSGSGGVLGTLEQVLAPVPLVGGGNGLLATVGDLLTGPPTTTASTGPVTSAAPASRSSSLLSLLG